MKKQLSHMCLLSALLLGGCASSAPEAPVCPQTGFMPHADQAAFFAEGNAAPALSDVKVYAALRNLQGTCERQKDGRTEIELKISLIAQRTMAGAAVAYQDVSYFIAVLSPEEEILQRKLVEAKAVFEDGVDTATIEEEYRIMLPPGDVAAQTVALGFVLTPEQVAFNRNRSRVQQDAAE